MSYLGDFTPGKTVRLAFNTHTTAGAPITLAGSPAVAVYKDGGTTESTTGVSAVTVDLDTRTGLHYLTVDTSADGTFYSAGSEFQVVLTAGTVDSQSVAGTVIGAFSLSARSALRPTTADRTLDVSSTGEAGIDLANVGSPTTTLNLSGTTISTSQQVASVSGAVGSVTGAVGSVTGAVTIDLTQTGITFRDVSAVTDEATITVADCFAAAFVQAAGDESVSGTTYTKSRPAGTAFRTFTLDSATTPTSRM